MDKVYLREHNTTKEKVLEWLDDLIVDAGIDKPYEMSAEDRQTYRKVLDIIEEHFTGGKDESD